MKENAIGEYNILQKLYKKKTNSIADTMKKRHLYIKKYN